MVEHHRRAGHGARQVGKSGVLVVVVPAVVGVAALAQQAQAGAKLGVGKQPLGAAAGDAQRLGVRVARAGMADAAEQPAPCRLVGRQRLDQQGAAPQVGMAHDAGDLGAAATVTAGAGQAGDEVGFADRFQMLGAVFAVSRPAFDEHGLDDVVAGAGVGPQVGQQVARTAAHRGPQVVVGVDDGPVGVDRRFARQVQPGGAAGKGACHGMLSVSNRLIR